MGLKFGFVGSFGSASELVTMAREAEEHGWDGYFTWDGISLPGMDSYDPWGILSAAAVQTERVTLGALVFALPRRRPWELARQALTVDHLSGGRLVLPVGVGVLDDAGFSADPGQLTSLRERAELLDDVLAFLERSWSGEAFSFDGTHISTGEMTISPRPVHGRIPVWPVGVFPSERSMSRAVRWDGVTVQLRGDRGLDPLSPEDVREVATWVAEHRDPAAGPFELVVQRDFPTDLDAAAQDARALEAAGATWWLEAGWDPTKVTAESQLARIRQGPPRP
ncbi:LLM class flavin-dependent oxidoreductase [Oerskovia douganii]|uniref:LLM class flavin-dependent oxidoreductase n=1 Tax=Oerskovia douganii TaxID=2762210 RepID=UPI002AAF9A65|nr:LLM class flavin-dependent oxidoreductase [Oerskovia douganii]